MKREISLPVAIAVIIVVILLIVGIWAWRERSARSYEERVREEVEKQLMEEQKGLSPTPVNPPVQRP